MPQIAPMPALNETHQSSLVRKAITGLLVKALRPLVLIMLRHGVTAYEFNEISRWVFTHVAMNRKQFALQERNVWSMTKSRAAVLTGLTRREIDRLASMPEPAAEEARASFHRGVRILNAWRHESGYQDNRGKPLTVPLKGPRGSLEWLIRNYSRDIPLRAMLDDLEDRGCIERAENDCVRFVHADFDGEPAPAEELDRLARHTGSFMTLVERRLAGVHPPGGFIEVHAGAIAPEHREAVQQRLSRAMQAFAADVDRELAACPKTLIGGQADNMVVGVYHGFT